MSKPFIIGTRLTIGLYRTNKSSVLEVIYKEKLKAATIEARNFYDDIAVAQSNVL